MRDMMRQNAKQVVRDTYIVQVVRDTYNVCLKAQGVVGQNTAVALNSLRILR